MKIGFVPTTVAIACLASSAQARIGTSRNLVGTNAAEDVLLDTTSTGVRNVAKIDLSEEIITVAEQDTIKVNQEISKPLPSFDQVMHVDAPKHGKYVKERPGRMDSFCARHNHFGPDCKQHHTSLRGGRKPNEKIATNVSGDEEPKSYLQEHLHEAQRNHERYRNQRQHQKQRPRPSGGK